jgi:hypothetical protein
MSLEQFAVRIWPSIHTNKQTNSPTTIKESGKGTGAKGQMKMHMITKTEQENKVVLDYHPSTK